MMKPAIEKAIFPIRILLLIGLLIFMISLQAGARTSKADIDTVTGKVLAAIDTSSMQEGSSRLLKKYYGLDASDYAGVAFYAPLSNMDAEELLIIKLKDSSQAEAVEEAVDSRLETQKTSFEGYGVEQYDLLENSSLTDVQGNYILFIVHSEYQAADDAFRASL